MHTITPFLWFDGKAEEAMRFYASIFDDAEVLEVSRLPDGAPGQEGPLVMGRFRVAGQEFIALNGGPMYTFSPAVSFFVSCETQEEVDRIWERLLEGGEAEQCGWLRDRYGLSWQVIPSLLGRLLGDPDPARAQRVMQAMLQMVKIDSAALQRAYDGS